MKGKEPSPKRLKLKDYMHLASIEKKQKSKSISNLSKTQVNGSSAISKSNLMASRDGALGRISPPSNVSLTMKNNTEIIKEEVIEQIEGQIRQLSDLKDYFENEFNEGVYPDKAQIMLFSLLNHLKSAGKKYSEDGEHIARHEGDKVTRKERENYFWESRESELRSPAKILE